mgnify:CR=1 FL=1
MNVIDRWISVLDNGNISSIQRRFSTSHFDQNSLLHVYKDSFDWKYNSSVYRITISEDIPRLTDWEGRENSHMVKFSDTIRNKIGKLIDDWEKANNL